MAMGSEPEKRGGGVLDPVERLSEILFGLIMAMTFTGSIHAAEGGHEEIPTVLVGAIGCNIAWGIVDAVMYLLTGLVTRSRALRAIRRLRQSKPAEAAAILEDVLPEDVLRAMAPRDFESVHAWVGKLPDRPLGALPPGAIKGAVGVFLLVTLSTFPLVVPFLVFEDPVTALRVSHGAALVMLFGIGKALGHYAGIRPWLMGLSMLGIGVVLAGVALALGG
jgi:VIT1/CCC1 family predicted Fe2+/Mn2+ transporter